MAHVYFITHPDVELDPEKPIERWGLSERGRRRMKAALERPWVAGLTGVCSSEEQKAIDGATILADALGIPSHRLAALGENDRSATGFLAPQEFSAMVDRFFGEPETSVRGWERAIDAQARIRGAVDEALDVLPQGDVAIVAHGGVGTLLLCHLQGVPIARERDQIPPPPGSPPGSGGGCYYAFDRESRVLLHGWRLIDEP